jgi:hypothetical protein
VPLRPASESLIAKEKESLNPCYTGCASSAMFCAILIDGSIVLILVILDVPLRPASESLIAKEKESLNPCYTGCASSASVREFNRQGKGKS